MDPVLLPRHGYNYYGLDGAVRTTCPLDHLPLNCYRACRLRRWLALRQLPRRHRLDDRAHRQFCVAYRTRLNSCALYSAPGALLYARTFERAYAA